MLPFANLPAQSPINLRADAYAEVSVRLSRLAAMTTRCVLDVPYGDHPEQRLDIYLPADPTLRDLPVFVNIHGGAWTHGFKEWMGLNAPPIVAVPAIYVSLGYRLAPHARFPAPFDDCLAAFAWVFRNIAKHGGSPDRLFVGGHSAGGQLAALIALRTDLHARHGLPKGVVKACLPTSGVFDMTYLEEDGTRARSTGRRGTRRPSSSPGGRTTIPSARRRRRSSPRRCGRHPDGWRRSCCRSSTISG
jgi:arylformamidase